MQTEQKILNIKHWNQLSKEQLEYVLSQEASDKGKVNIFLYLSGLTIVPPEVPEDVTEDVEGFEESLASIGDILDNIQAVLDGKKVCLREIGSKNGTLYYADVNDLAFASMEHLKWMEKDRSLLSLPFDTMKIGKHEYKMPDALMMNSTYQQYSNAQGYMLQYWNILQRVSPPEDETDDEEKVREVRKVRGKKKKWVAPSEAELVELAKQMVEARNGFMAALLVPYRWKVKARYPFFFREPFWEAESEAEAKADMMHAPMWLFDALYKQWQDNVQMFRRKFPDMFTEAKADPKHDAFVAELGTINLVIEKGGYGNASAVYNENCVFIFKLINDQIKEAKELEKMNRSSKVKG